jgi:methanogenic corrinoid protein MtbC1
MAPVKKQLTMADITRLTMLYLCRDPDTLSQIMLASAGADAENDTDGSSCKELLEFCKQEGIDPLPAIKKALELSPFEKIFRSRR